MEFDDRTDPRYQPPAAPEASAPVARIKPQKAVSSPQARFYPLNPRSLEDLGLTASQLEAALLRRSSSRARCAASISRGISGCRCN